METTAEPAELKINLACGQTKEEGWLGVDAVKAPGVDIVADLLKFPWKFAKPDSVDELASFHFVEHIPHGENPPYDLFFRFFDEAYKLLKVGGKFTVVCPYVTSRRAFQDPTHRRFICEQSFLYLNKAWRDANRLNHYPVTCDFDFNYSYALAPHVASRHDEARIPMVTTQWEAVQDIHVFLTKRAPQ